jgi:hypothetical protein
MFKNKRGEDAPVISNWLFWIMYVGAIGMVIIFIVKIGTTFAEESSAIPLNLEDEIVLISRFYNSDNCFAYKDELGLTHPKVLDPNKLNQDQLNSKCFPSGNVNYAFSIWVEQDLPEGILGPPFPFTTQKLFTKNYLGGLEDKFFYESVIIMDNEVRMNALMVIGVKYV